MTTRRLVVLLAFLTLTHAPPARGADPTKPVKVFILAGQSNMEGQAVADLEGKDYNGGKGTLKALLNDPTTPPRPRSSSTSGPTRAPGRSAATSGSATGARGSRCSPAR
jgi:hypothetical protein